MCPWYSIGSPGPGYGISCDCVLRLNPSITRACPLTPNLMGPQCRLSLVPGSQAQPLHAQDKLLSTETQTHTLTLHTDTFTHTRRRDTQPETPEPPAHPKALTPTGPHTIPQHTSRTSQTLDAWLRAGPHIHGRLGTHTASNQAKPQTHTDTPPPLIYLYSPPAHRQAQEGFTHLQMHTLQRGQTHTHSRGHAPTLAPPTSQTKEILTALPACRHPACHPPPPIATNQGNKPGPEVRVQQIQS